MPAHGNPRAAFCRAARVPPRTLDRARRPDAGPHNPRASIPFGGGPRFCPDRNLALLEIKVVLAMVLRNFELELADPTQPVEEEFAFTMGPKKLEVRLRERPA